MTKHIRSLICLLGLLFCQNAFSWGTLGHKTTALIAWNYLNSQQRQALTQALRGQSITAVATWADGARATAEFKHTTWYHFEKVNDNVDYLKNLKDMGPNYWKLGGPIEALFLAEEQFKDPKANLADKENALKFAIHFIADLHQPLHTGRVDDNGGNKIRVLWNGLAVNLHQVWDSLLIYQAHQDILQGLAEDEQTAAYAKYLINKLSNKVPAELTRTTYEGWVSEIMALRTLAYDNANVGEVEYAKKFGNDIDQRVFLAGVRMSIMLARLLEQQPVTSPLNNLRRQIVQIVGEFSQFLSLKPSSAPTTPISFLN